MQQKIGISLFFTGFVALSLGFFAGYILVHRGENDPIVGGYDSFGKLSPLETSALLGSRESSTKIAIKFDECLARTAQSPAGISKECLLKSRFWGKIDAENGGGYGAYVVYSKYMNSESCASAARAVFWAYRASDPKSDKIVGRARGNFKDKCR